jgi:hypothetical protein
MDVQETVPLLCQFNPAMQGGEVDILDLLRNTVLESQLYWVQGH